jgi:hypothetical protein
MPPPKPHTTKKRRRIQSTATRLCKQSRSSKKAEAKLVEARAEEKRKEFARALDPLIEALGGARNAVAAGNERALAAALP